TYLDPGQPALGYLDGCYLGGGDTFAGAPAACRFFSGGGFGGSTIPGSTLAIDNLHIVPYPRVECPADINSDGQVDLRDLVQLLSHYGTPGGGFFTDGDLDGDGDIDQLDLAALLADFGTVCR